VADDFWKEAPYVPCFADLFGLAGALIPHPREATFSLLDIGSGSGAFATQVAQNFSNARLTLLEADQTLLRKSLSRLGPDAPRARSL
jgi:methylase of polypeptide subunit release factors